MSGNNILLDSNIVLYLLNGEETLVPLLEEKQLYVSFIAQIETLGYKGISEKEILSIKSFLNQCVIVDVNPVIKDYTIKLRQEHTIKLPDSIIAATSLYLNAPLITADTDFTYEEDRVSMLETNIDNMNPEFYEYTMDRLLKKGARDVFLTPVHMKKNRPGILLSVISPLDRENELLDIIFNETTTLGVRITRVSRKKIKRDIKTINTP